MEISKHILANILMIEQDYFPDLLMSIGMRSNFFIDGKYFPSEIEDCAEAIPVGGNGSAKIMVIQDEIQPLYINIGDKFELRAGPIKTIAEGEVISIVH